MSPWAPHWSLGQDQDPGQKQRPGLRAAASSLVAERRRLLSREGRKDKVEKAPALKGP